MKITDARSVTTINVSDAKPASIATVITDEKLFELCKRYGSSALLWRQKFTGLLPEVNRRRLYEKKGFSTIFEFAAKLCGLSEEQVCLALNLKKRFEDMPTLKKMLEEGEVSINKLTRIVSIATPENEKELAEKVKILPVRALETLVRDEKIAMKNLKDSDGNTLNTLVQSKIQNGFQKPLFGGKSLHVQTFELADDVKEQLSELHSKGIDINELLRKFLKQRKEEIEKKKEEIVKEILNKSSQKNINQSEDGNTQKPRRTLERNDVRETSTAPSRYIPVKVKKVLHEEHGTKCSIPTCQKPAEVIHHTQTFGLSHIHDPRFMAPLCKEHHAIAHSVNVKFQEISMVRSW